MLPQQTLPQQTLFSLFVRVLNQSNKIVKGKLGLVLSILIASSFTLTAILVNTANAETVEQIAPDFSEKSLSLPSTTNKVIIWAETNGNSSSPVFVRIDGPVGSVITLDAAKKPGVVTNQILTSSSGWYNLPLGNTVKPTGTKSLSINSLRRLQTASNNRSVSELFNSSAENTPNLRHHLADTLRQPLGIGADLCSALSPADIKTIGETLFGSSWTRDKVCSWLRDQVAGSPGFNEEGLPFPGGGNGGSGIGDDLPNPVASTPTNPNDPFFSNQNYSSLSTRALLNKDACSLASDKYLIRLTIDLSSVNRAALGSLIAIKGRLFTDEYKGRTSASIKPESEGKFFPKPLVLMSSLGWNESISVRQWKNGVPTGRQEIPVDGSDRVFWQGLVLARAPIDKLLRAGSSLARNFATSEQLRRRKPPTPTPTRVNKKRRPKRPSSPSNGRIRAGQRATFELYTPDKSYGVCLSVKRSRQRVNGYPG